MARRSVLPPSTWVLRAVVAGGPVLALELGRAAGHVPGLPWLVAVVVLALAWARRPGAWFGTGAAVVVIGWWVLTLREAVPVAVVPAAAALTAAHVAALLADLGPERMRLDGDVRRLWVGRATTAALAAAGLWLVAAVASGTTAPGIWLLAVVATTATAAGTAAVLTRSND